MVRQKLGIPIVKWDYDQSAVVAVLHLSEVSIVLKYITMTDHEHGDPLCFLRLFQNNEIQNKK